MKNPTLVIIVLSVALIITGGLLRDWVVLSTENKHIVGQFAGLAGLIALVTLLFRAFRSNKEK